MQSKVSIIIPVYNCEKYIGKCIESILKQSYKNIEIIIVNDGSKDKTSEVINLFSANDNRVIYIEQQNSGPSVARNNGISKATGEYITFIDSDDYIESNYIEALLDAIQKNKRDIVCCGYNDISEYGIVKHTDFMEKNDITKNQFLYDVCQGTGGVLWNKIFKKDILDKYNIKMEKDIFMCEDLIFVLRYGSHCNSFGYIDKYLYNYNRLNSSSISTNISKDYINNYIEVCKKIEVILINNGFEKEKINKIICSRVQSGIISIIDSESKKILINGIKSTSSNLSEILNYSYIKLYKSSFKSDIKLYKPYVYFIRKNKVLSCILYSYMLNMIRNIKNKINNKIQVE